MQASFADCGLAGGDAAAPSRLTRAQLKLWVQRHVAVHIALKHGGNADHAVRAAAWRSGPPPAAPLASAGAPPGSAGTCDATSADIVIARWRVVGKRINPRVAAELPGLRMEGDGVVLEHGSEVNVAEHITRTVRGQRVVFARIADGAARGSWIFSRAPRHPDTVLCEQISGIPPPLGAAIHADVAAVAAAEGPPPPRPPSRAPDIALANKVEEERDAALVAELLAAQTQLAADRAAMLDAAAAEDGARARRHKQIEAEERAAAARRARLQLDRMRDVDAAVACAIAATAFAAVQTATSDATVAAYVHARDAAAAATALADTAKKAADARAAQQRPYREGLARRHRNSLLAVSARLHATKAPADPFVWALHKLARDLKYADALLRRATTEHAAVRTFLKLNGAPAPHYLDASSTAASLGEGAASISVLLEELDEWIDAARLADGSREVQEHLEAHHLLLSRRLALTELAEREVRAQLVELWDSVERVYVAKAHAGEYDLVHGTSTSTELGLSTHRLGQESYLEVQY